MKIGKSQKDEKVETATAETPADKAPAAPANDVPVSREEFDKLMSEQEELKKLIRAAGDQNKIAAFDRAATAPKGYMFNLTLWPITYTVKEKDGSERTAEREAVVLATALVRNEVRGGKDSAVDQLLELTLDDRSAPEGERKDRVQVKYSDYVAHKRITPKIECKKMETVDKQPIAVIRDANGNAKLVVPTKELILGSYQGKTFRAQVAFPFKVTLDYAGKEYTVETRYLN